jgi:hypothetical protein
MVHLVHYQAHVSLLISEVVVQEYLPNVKEAAIFNSNVDLHVKLVQEMLDLYNDIGCHISSDVLYTVT